MARGIKGTRRQRCDQRGAIHQQPQDEIDGRGSEVGPNVGEERIDLAVGFILPDGQHWIAEDALIGSASHDRSDEKVGPVISLMSRIRKCLTPNVCGQKKSADKKAPER